MAWITVDQEEIPEYYGGGVVNTAQEGKDLPRHLPSSFVVLRVKEKRFREIVAELNSQCRW